MARILSFAILLFFGIFSGLLVFANAQLVSVNLYFTVVDLELGMALLLAVLAGIFLAIIFSITIVLRYRRKAKMLEKQNKLITEEITTLRKMPIKEMH